MWFRTQDGRLINLDNVENTEICQGTDTLRMKSGRAVPVCPADRLDIERLLIKRHVLKYREIPEEAK